MEQHTKGYFTHAKPFIRCRLSSSARFSTLMFDYFQNDILLKSSFLPIGWQDSPAAISGNTLGTNLPDFIISGDRE